MRKKFAAGGLAVLGALAFGVGGTYAAFSNTEQGPNTLVQTGKLDLRLSTDHGYRSHRFSSRISSRVTHTLLFRPAPQWRHGSGESKMGVQELSGTQERVRCAGDRGCPVRGAPVFPQVVGSPSFPSSVSQVFFRSLDGLVLAPGVSRCVRVDVKFLDLSSNNKAQNDSSIFGFRFQLVS
jgi:predicted ribosomally synthesized peptide with SipW-like signal peptide